MTDVSRLAVATLATHRLTRLTCCDDITDPAREYMFKRLGTEHYVSRLVTCPWCSSVWWAGALALSLRLKPRLISALAVASAVGLIFQTLDQE